MKTCGTKHIQRIRQDILLGSSRASIMNFVIKLHRGLRHRVAIRTPRTVSSRIGHPLDSVCTRTFSQYWNMPASQSLCTRSTITQQEEWHDLGVDSSELRLEITLTMGQAFRWIKTAEGEYTSTLHDKLIVLRTIPSSNDALSPGKVQFLCNPTLEPQYRSLLHDYFNLNIDINALYKRWNGDTNFRKRASMLTGIRLLRQDPLECLLAFICSANNNIKRISKMVTSLCTNYGSFVGSRSGIDFYSFPSIEQLASAKSLESELRQLGFGYRAKYISQTVTQLQSLPTDYLITLRKQNYIESKLALLEFAGVGPKVADCILLMSLDQADAVPVDTHVLRISERDYGVKVKGKSLTNDLYERVQSVWRNVFGEWAGWAQNLLFAAEVTKVDLMVEVPNVSQELVNGDDVKTVKVEETVVKVKEEELPSADADIDKVVVKKELQDTSFTVMKKKRKVEEVQVSVDTKRHCDR